MMKLLEIAANKAFETTYFNITGMGLNDSIKFNPTTTNIKKIREFFNKNPIIKTFLNGMDKKDERIFVTDIKGQLMYSGDRVIRNKKKDRALFFVVTGTFFTLDDNYPNMGPVYKPGAVIGVD